jgi:hypothetical protein
MLDKQKDDGDRQEVTEAKAAPVQEVQRSAVIGDTGSQARWNRAQQAHYLGQDESATDLFRKPGDAANSTGKFTIDGLEEESHKSHEGNLGQAKIAQNFDYIGGLPTLVPSIEQLGLDQILNGMNSQQHQMKHPFRGHIGEVMKAISEETWTDAYSRFPQFKEAGLSEKRATELMQAIVRNELFFYDMADGLDDKSVRETGKPMQYPFKERKAGEATLGVSQVSVDGVRKFETEFPEQMGRYVGREAEALLNPIEAPMMVAAVLAHNIKCYRGHYPINEGTLAYSFNPDVSGEKGKKPPTDDTLKESDHYANVMRQLAIIRGQVEPRADEH